MRVIAVGDDDQNIYSFRGSDSYNMLSLVEHDGAKLYEMTDNYRSASAVVDYANRYVKLIPGRIKKTLIHSVTGEEGVVGNLKSLLDSEIRIQGSTAILTRTNEEMMQVAYELKQRGIHATVVQSMGDFRFGSLAEVRYFLKQLGQQDEVVISKEKWQQAKRRTLETYASSTCLSIMQHFFTDFEATHKAYFRSDLREFIFESKIEDFIAADEHSIFVSTIHKAKGREFDTVYLQSQVPDGKDIAEMRTYYVGLTRAKRNLFLATNPLNQFSSIFIALNMHDVVLDFFKARKDIILRMRCGDKLWYRDGYLFDEQGGFIAQLSTSGKKKLESWQEKGYEITTAEISYILAWHPKDVTKEYAVCLSNIVLSRKIR